MKVPLDLSLPAAVKATANAAMKAMVPAPVPAGETEFLKVMTDDPDVVILWAINTEGDR